MRQIPLSRGQYAIVDDADYKAVRAAGPWYAKPCWSGFYAMRTRGGRTVYLHRFLAGEDAATVDHINGNGLDNRRGNLRSATVSENSRNRPAKRGNASGFKGVSRHRSKWKATIAVAGRNIHLGTYADPAHAARVYDAAAREHYGEFAVFNFPKEMA